MCLNAKSVWYSYTKQVFVLCIIPKEIKKKKGTISKALRFRNSILSKSEVRVYSLGYSLNVTCISCSSLGKGSMFPMGHRKDCCPKEETTAPLPSSVRLISLPHGREKQPSCSDHGESQTTSSGESIIWHPEIAHFHESTVSVFSRYGILKAHTLWPVVWTQRNIFEYL